MQGAVPAFSCIKSTGGCAVQGLPNWNHLLRACPELLCLHLEPRAGSCAQPCSGGLSPLFTVLCHKAQWPIQALVLQPSTLSVWYRRAPRGHSQRFAPSPQLQMQINNYKSSICLISWNSWLATAILCCIIERNAMECYLIGNQSVLYLYTWANQLLQECQCWPPAGKPPVYIRAPKCSPACCGFINKISWRNLMFIDASHLINVVELFLNLSFLIFIIP